MAFFNRSVASVYLAYALMSTAQAISWQFVTFFVKHDLNATSFIELSLASALPAFIIMMMAPVWGSLSDRWKKRRIFMIIGFIGYASTFVFYAFVADILQYLIVAGIGAMFSSAALPMGQAHLTTNADNKGERLGYFVAAQSGGWFFGALFSGVLYDIVGMRFLFIAAAILSLAATASSAILIKDIPFNEVIDSGKRRLIDILRKPGMSRLTAAVALSQIGMNAIGAFLAIMIVDELGGNTSFVGLSNSGATFIAVIFTGYVGKIVDRRGPIKVLIIAYFSYTIFACLFGLVRDPVIATIMWALPIYPLSSTATSALAALISGEDERGRAMSLVYGAQNAGGWIGPIIGGIFAEYVFLTVQPISFINAAFNFVAMLLVISLLRTMGSMSGQKEIASDNVSTSCEADNGSFEEE
ncbi:MAG: MFS transporter [Candidatus Thorarchaeota archaeon]|nr:MAG: MFS transporter [Candidatus Thorarchaeota archaeon]